MLVAADSLASHIERHGVARAFIIFGEEPLQAAESADLVRAAARADGVSERLLFEVEAGFDWQSLQSGASELSLFAERRLIEIRLGTRKPDKAGSATLIALLAREDLPDIFLVTAERLDRNAQKGKWFKAIETAGVAVQAKSIKGTALERWIARRAERQGMRLAPAAAELIAVRAEGNLLAAAQELDKLSLLVERGEVDTETVVGAMVDHARFDVFGLIDVTLAGDSAKAVRMLRGLREEGTEAVVIGWALNRELRNLAHMAADVAKGESMQSVLNGHNVWRSRTGIVRRALERSTLGQVTRMFRTSMRIDRMIKGALIGNPWDELERLFLDLSRKH